jgi:hypothetical protein
MIIDRALEVCADGVLNGPLRALHLYADRAILHLCAVIIVAIVNEDVTAERGFSWPPFA